MQICWVQIGSKCLFNIANSCRVWGIGLLTLELLRCVVCKRHTETKYLYVLFRCWPNSLKRNVLGFFLIHMTFFFFRLVYWLLSCRPCFGGRAFLHIFQCIKKKSKLRTTYDVKYSVFVHVFEILGSEPCKLYACACRPCVLFHQNNVTSVKSGMSHDRHGTLVSKIRQHADKLLAFLLWELVAVFDSLAEYKLN